MRTESGTFGSGFPSDFSFASASRKPGGLSLYFARSSLNALLFCSNQTRAAAPYSFERKSDQKFTIATPPFLASSRSMSSLMLRR